MRIRTLLLPAVLASLLASLGLTAVVTASPTRTQTSTLRFITSGLSCTNGVCALGSGNVGANYGQNIAITGGSCGRPCVTLPVFTVVAGSLPPGLRMPSTYGCCGDAIGGTPSQAGTFSFTIQVKDGAGNTARQAFRIVISPPARLKITFPTTCCSAGIVGQSYLQNFFLSGGVAPFAASIAAGQLPPGLKLSSSPPISITGTPTTAGTFTFTVRVTDSNGAQATEQGSITVR
jgi:Putative Ig domain